MPGARPERAQERRSPSIDESRAHYDAWNEAHRNAGFDAIEPEIRARAERVLRHLERRLPEHPVRILEVGCGTGWMAERLHRLGSVTAVDLSPRAIEIARRRGIPARFIAGDFLALDLDDEPHDVVVCLETLFYVHDQQAFVERMAAQHRPGGLLLLSFINRWVYERSSDVRRPGPGHLRQWLTVSQVRALLARHYDVMSVETVAPRGDRGILRLVNSHKLGVVLDRLLGSGRARRLKERAGLGGGVVMVVRRRS